MTILDRYILKEFLRIFTLIIITLVSLYLVVDFFERIRMFISNHATAVQVLSYFLYSLPIILSQMLPVTFFLGTLITFSILSGHNELMAIKASGMSLYRTAAPVIVLSIFACVISFFLTEYVTPLASEKVKYVKYVEIQKKKKTGVFKQYQLWYRGRDGIYNIAYADPEHHTLKGVRINYLDHDMNLLRRIDAREARWERDSWIGTDVLVTTFTEKGIPHIEKKATFAIDITEKPEDFTITQKAADEMGYFELKNYITTLESQGYDTQSYRADLYGKLAFSLVTIILALLGVAYSLSAVRSGGIARSIGVGIAIGFSYWLVFAFSVSLGRSGALHPFVAAWTANAILGAVAVVSFAKIKT